MNPAFNGPEADANGNGIANAIEFALGSSSITPLALELVGPPGNQTAQLTLTRNSLARGITLIVECTADFVSWTPLASSINGSTPTGPAAIAEGTGIIRILTIQAPVITAHTFFRVRVLVP